MGKFKPPTRSLGLQSEPSSNKYGFVFSDDINQWMHSKPKVHNENCRKKYAQKKSLRHVRVSGLNHVRILNDNLRPWR